MKILSAEQFGAWDESTIEQGIASIDLMERAATLCVQEIVNHTTRDTIFIVLCGMGNNGGDGMAITRMLHQQGYQVRAVIVHHGKDYSDDAHINLEKLFHIQPKLIAHLNEGYFIQEIAKEIVIIDAILGTGASRPLAGWLAELIGYLNDLPNEKIAIDMPTGLMADQAPQKDDVVLKANKTLTFQSFKRVMLHPESEAYLGAVQVLNIGLDKEFIEQVSSPYALLHLKEARTWVKPISKFAHKGNKGTATIVAGSEGMSGAALLAAHAALRVGAGKVLIQSPECNLVILQIGLPEAMVKVSGKKSIQRIEFNNADALAIGPGIGTDEEVMTALRNFLNQATEPVVLDADALNILAKEPTLIHKIPANSIITPHVKEYERLFGTFKNSMARLENARTQAMKYNLNIILKGHYTQVISSKGHVYYNTSGNAALATAGSGDVLLGVLAGLMAQGYDAQQASLLSVFLHGVAGEHASKNLGIHSVLASDIIAHLHKGWQMLTVN